MARCLIALGSNQGNRAATIQAALEGLVASGELLLARSGNYLTPAVGGPSGQAEYLNAAAILETSNSPEQLLHQLMATEQRLGRVRDERWGARTIDLDLLLYDAQILEQPNLIVPHPRLGFRRFILAPSAEIAASWEHPQIGWSLQKLLDHIDSAPNYAAICGTPSDDARTLCGAVVDRTSSRILHLNWVPPSDVTLDAYTKRFENAAALLRQAPLPSPNDRWLISDFWEYDALALARAGGNQSARLAANSISNHEMIERRPKLLIVIQDSESNDEYGSALDEVLNTYYEGPILRLIEQSDDSVSEVVAAMQGMMGA